MPNRFRQRDFAELKAILARLRPAFSRPLGFTACVLMDRPDDSSPGGILYAKGPYEGKNRPDTGTVVWRPTLDGNFVQEGQRVIVSPYMGLWLDHGDYDWIPAGEQVRLYLARDVADAIECVIEGAA